MHARIKKGQLFTTPEGRPVRNVRSYQFREVMNDKGGAILVLPYDIEWAEYLSRPGTGLMLVDEDSGELIHACTLTPGNYYNDLPEPTISDPYLERPWSRIHRRIRDVSNNEDQMVFKAISYTTQLSWRRTTRGEIPADDSRLNSGNVGLVVGNLVLDTAAKTGSPNYTNELAFRDLYETALVQTTSVGAGSNVMLGNGATPNTYRTEFRNITLLEVIQQLILEAGEDVFINIWPIPYDSGLTISSWLPEFKLSEFNDEGVYLNIQDFANLDEDNLPITTSLIYSDTGTGALATAIDEEWGYPSFSPAASWPLTHIAPARIDAFVGTEISANDINTSLDMGGLSLLFTLKSEYANDLKIGDIVSVGYYSSILSLPVREIVGEFKSGVVFQTAQVGLQRPYGSQAIQQFKPSIKTK